MKRVLIAIVNFILLLTLPLWGGIVILGFIIADCLEDKRTWQREKYVSALKGERFFWKD